QEDGSPQVAADIRIGIFTASPRIFMQISPQGLNLLKAAVNYALSPRIKTKVAPVKIKNTKIEQMWEGGLTTQEDTPVVVTLFGSDPDENQLTFKVVSGPFHGRLDGTAPKLIYTPESNFFGSDSFTFKVNDGMIDSTPITVLIKVAEINDQPIAKEECITIQEDTPALITLRGSDADGDILSYGVVKGPSYGSLSGRGPNLSYMPNENFFGTDSFTFKVNDGMVDSAEATVSIKLIQVNDPPTGNYSGSTIQDNPPVARNDSVTTKEDHPIIITLSGSGLVNEKLIYSVIQKPLKGSLSGKSPKLIYVPDINFNGSDSFTFKVSYEDVVSNIATVSILVTPDNDPPIAKDDSATTKEDTPVVIDVLTNDTDIDGDQLGKVTIQTQSKNGSVTIEADNKLSYTPKANFFGIDSFTYRVFDDGGKSDTARVNIKVEMVEDPPVASDVSVTTQEDKSVFIMLKGNDPDGDKLSFDVTEEPSHGKLSGTKPHLRYTPKANFNGSDSFTFKVNDGKATSEKATVSIKVIAENDPPTVSDVNVTTQEDRPVLITLKGSDLDGDKLSFNVTKKPSHGKLSGMKPHLRYTPKANFNGSDSFTFKVNDGKVNSKKATVSIKVTAENDPPVARDDRAKTKEDTSIERINVLANDTDVENSSLKITNVTQGKNGSVGINSDNTVSYEPYKNFFGTDLFTYTISDGAEGKTDTAAVKVIVKAVNDTPSFTSTAITSGSAGEKYIYDVDATDLDKGDTLTYFLTEKPAGMTIDVTTGLIEWTPTNEQAGDNDVVVKVTDNSNAPASETQSFTIKVEPVIPPEPEIEPEPEPEPTPPVEPEELPAEGKKILLVDSASDILKASDNNRQKINSGLTTSYNFSDISIPADAVIKSVLVYLEHFEDEQFPEGKLLWTTGTGWPNKPTIWASINAPIYKGEKNESRDLWDVTSFANTPEKVNSLQLQIKNNDTVSMKKTSVDYMHVIVEWH
ncbi:MAG: Ig-like domain-containing protein, partial [Phycisphaerales bacterium]